MQTIPPLDRIVFQTELVAIGAFRCAPDHPRFTDSGPITRHCFVFPRSAVTIEHEHARPFVANPNVVTLYNRGQRYARGQISREGDRCDWFGVESGILRDVLRELDPTVDERSDELFVVPSGMTDAALYLRQRQLFEWVCGEAAVDALAVEENVIALLERVILLACVQAPKECGKVARGEVTRHVEQILSERWNENLQLAELAREVDLSVYHLCHRFRRETGTTLHQYRHQLRLRASLEPLRQSQRALLEIALQLGFSSHSHFTSMFQREFGISPSKLRSNTRNFRSRAACGERPMG